MPWVKLDDHFDEHPKIASIGDSALALWVCGLAYCNRNLTDGFIPSMVGMGKLRWCDGNTVPAIRELEQAGMWEQTDGGWNVHNYDKYQPSRESALQERLLKAQAGRAGGLKTQSRVRDGEIEAPVKARYAQLKADLKASALADAQADVRAPLKPVPVPVPDPKEKDSLFDGIWSAYPKKVGRPAAIRAFNALHASEELCATITADIARRLQSSEWSKDNGQFIPNPATYLNQRRWEDQGVDVGLFKSEAGTNGTGNHLTPKFPIFDGKTMRSAT